MSDSKHTIILSNSNRQNKDGGELKGEKKKKCFSFNDFALLAFQTQIHVKQIFDSI